MPITVLSAPPQSRIRWVDVARGIGIVLVTYGHLRNGDGDSVWLPGLDDSIDIVYLFHMPLFFLLSGITFSTKKPWKEFVSRKIHTLLVPYYVFSLYFLAKPLAIFFLPTLAEDLRSDHDYELSNQVVGVVLWGKGLWFLWALFIGDLIVYGVVHLLHSKPSRAMLSVILLISSFSASAIYGASDILPFQILSGIEAAGFIILGILLKPLLLSCSRRGSLFLGSSTLLLFLAIVCFHNSYGSAALYATVTYKIFAAAFGSLFVVFVSIAISKLFVLEHIGRNSLTFYAINAMTMNLIKLLFFVLLNVNVLGSSTLFQALVGLITTAAALGLSQLFSSFIRRWMWWSIGAKKPSH